jgi:hypothetical protein
LIRKSFKNYAKLNGWASLVGEQAGVFGDATTELNVGVTGWFVLKAEVLQGSKCGRDGRDGAGLELA